jgi:hypothetical protein
LKTLVPIAAILLALLLPGSLEAQTLRGRLVEEGSGEPIAGAFVLLYPSEGDASPKTPPLAADLTASGGLFALAAPRPGRYRVRVDRIGYRSHLTDAIEVGAGATASTTINVPLEPVELPAIVAEVESECEVDPRDSDILARAWEEARKALTTAVWARQHGVFRFTAHTYERIESPTGVTLEERTQLSAGLGTESPYVSLPIEDLVAKGYVREKRDTLYFYAPDAEGLLSDAFLDEHCFRLVPGAQVAQPGWIGLAFEPVQTRRRSDIQGVIWIDRDASELRRLDFRYTRLPEILTGYDPGGRIEFARVGAGAWIVRRWWIRAPSVEVEPRRARGRLVGYVVSGGEVTIE